MDKAIQDLHEAGQSDRSSQLKSIFKYLNESGRYPHVKGTLNLGGKFSSLNCAINLATMGR